MTPERLPEGTKRGLLDLLVRRERTAEELAALLGVSPTAVRQHLATLAGLGLVERRKSGTTGGRPAFLYRLTPHAHRAYPKRHDLLVREILEAVIEREGEEEALAIVTDAARHLARKVHVGDGEPGAPGRLEALAARLEEEFAWEADFERRPDGGLQFVVHQCPFQAVSTEHPAVCGAFFRTLLEELTNAGPFLHRPVGDGICCCALESASERGAS